jgi:hypothetical protein
MVLVIKQLLVVEVFRGHALEERSGGIVGITRRWGRSSGFSRNFSGYLSGFQNSSGSVERHT